jgi:hypothetical protein
MKRMMVLIFLAVVCIACSAADSHAASCEDVVRDFNRRLSPRIDESELIRALRALNNSRNRSLPDTFVTKREARSAGWRPGSDLWRVTGLKGKSIGGDRFGNREGHLPAGGRKWREADLDYKGKLRGAKRLLFADDGLRMVTVDHYKTFIEVPACR